MNLRKAAIRRLVVFEEMIKETEFVLRRVDEELEQIHDNERATLVRFKHQQKSALSNFRYYADIFKAITVMPDSELKEHVRFIARYELEHLEMRDSQNERIIH